MKRRALKFTVILLALSCSETEFDADVKEKQTASNTEDATIGVDATGLPPTADDSSNGSNGNKQTDTFQRERHKGLLDLLLVIDDSGSMKEVHKRLKNRLNNLLTDIDNSNWQIKIVDADPSDMCEHTIISKANKGDYTTRLDDFASSGGAKQERTLQKARAALKLSPYENVCPAWLRAGSTLAAVIITDENHQCDNPSATDNRGDGNSFQCHGQDSVEDFIIDFEGLRTNTRLYGIFDTEETCRDTREVYTKHSLSCFDHSATNRGNDKCKRTNPCYNRGDRYKWRSASYLAKESEFDDILHLHEDVSEYDDFLEKISEGIKEVLQDQFTLTKEPKAGTVTVTVDGDSNTGFTISGKILTFTPSLPEDAEEITVAYVPKSP